MSNITKQELSNIQADPVAAIALLFNRIDATDGGIMNVDPSNPFALMAETIAFNSAAIRDEITTKYHRLFSKLANSDSDLYNNISYTDFKNIFSQPANSTIRFIINITDFESNAVVNGEYQMVTIPELSTLSVEGFNFLLANSIDIKKFKNGSFSIEQNVSSVDIGVSTLGVLPHTIVTNDDSNRMLIFDTILKQITLESKTYTINKTDKFSDLVPIVDKLHYITAYTTNGTASTRVEVSYSEIIDPNKPTVIIKILNDSIEIVVPDVYIINNLIRGKLHVDIFTTKGEVDYPLEKIPAKEFKLVYNNTTGSSYKAAINNINIATNALHRLTGGTNGKTFEELRESVIANSIGDVTQPITKAQIVDMLARGGYFGYLLEDTITDRLFIASKALPMLDMKRSVNASPDILFYKAKIISGNYLNHPNIKVTDTTDDRLSIKPYTLLRNVNGLVEPLTTLELDAINNMNEEALLSYLNVNDILYSPYSYITSLHGELYSMRIVDFRPRINTFSIRAINSNILYKANIGTYVLELTPTGYRLSLRMSTNSEFDKLDPSLVKAQLRMKISGTDDVYVYFYSNYFTNKEFRFDINTDYYVDEANGLWLNNGTSLLSTKVIDLASSIELVTYVDTPATEAETNNYINELVVSDRSVVALTLEEIDVVFGTVVEDIHRNLSVGYTNRRYVTYEEDVVATYNEDIYDTNEIGGMMEANDDHTEVIYTLLHSRGDVMLDAEGEPIIRHKAGSYVLDSNGNPTVDRMDGVVKYIDMVLLEYSDYIVANKNDSDIVSTISTYLKDINAYKDLMLEETNLKFKPFRTNDAIKIKHNNAFKLVLKPIRPEVELYIESSTKVNNDNPLELQTIIGSIIHMYLNRDMFYIADIKETIKENINIDISAIKINLDRNENSPLTGLEKVSLYDAANRIRIQKQVVNNLGYASSTYDVNIIITKI